MSGLTNIYFNNNGDDYKCSLSDYAAEIALKELREDAATREHALKHMREWIRKHPDIRKCRTDSPFLLRFLRTRKFSIPQAQELLERYLMNRQLFPHWFQKLDYEDPVLNEIIDSGYIVPLLQRDRNGRLVVLADVGRFDPHRYTSNHMARLHSLVSEAYMDDEENQVLGYVHVNDEQNITMGHVSLWSLTDIRKLMNCLQRAAPIRLKGSYMVNLPPYAYKIIEVLRSALSHKIRSRVEVYPDISSLSNYLDPKILPREFGGEIPKSEMIAALKAKLKERAEALSVLDEMYIHIRPDSNQAKLLLGNDDIMHGVAGSFRKLEVD